MPGSVHQRPPIQHPVAKLVAHEAPHTVLVPLRVTWEAGVGGQHDDVLDVPPCQVSTSCGRDDKWTLNHGREGKGEGGEESKRGGDNGGMLIGGDEMEQKYGRESLVGDRWK